MKQSNFFKITFIYFISLLLFVGIRIIFQLGFLSNVDDRLSDLFSSGLIQIIVMGLIPFILYLLFFKKKPKEALNSFGYKKITGRAILISIGIGIIAFFLNIVISSIFNGIITSFGYENHSSGGSSDYSVLNFFITVFCTAILPALFEEFLHRGLLMRGLFNSISVKNALIISSICFGLMHLNIVQVFYATILGLLIGFVSIIGRSIWPAVIIHFVNNFINVYLSFAQNNNWVFGDFYNTLNDFLSNNWLFALVIVIIVITALLFLLIRLLMSLLKVTCYENFKNVIINIKESLNKNEVNHQTVAEENNDLDLEEIEPIIFENLHKHKTMSEALFNDIYPKEKLVLRDKIFLTATIFLGVFITVATFIWGVI